MRNKRGYNSLYPFLVTAEIVLFVTIFMAPKASALDPVVVSEAAKMGSMYNCPPNMRPSAYFIIGNVGYDFIGDEMHYAYAKLLNEKGCHEQGDEKYVLFYVTTVNFPSNGTPAGNGSDVEQGWLEYWDYNARRFSDLGYKIIIHPLPFVIKDAETNLDYPPGLRPLVKSDLNLASSEIPVVFECRDGRKTVLASIYDPKTLSMAVKFYEGIKNFFSKYPAFAKISIVPPSDFGEYGFPFGINTRWWEGSDAVGDCYLTGDVYARQMISGDTPSYDQYNGKLNEFRQALMQQVKTLFPDKRYVIYMGYGDDTNPRDGFSYQEVTSFAVTNGIELHSSHGRGLDYDDVVLSKINQSRPENYNLTFEDSGLLNEFLKLKSLYHAAKNDVDGMVLYSVFFYDYFYLAHLLYSMSQSGNKGMTFDAAGGLGSLKSTYLVNGYMDIPKNGDTINGDIQNQIGGWGYYEAPYGDHHYYGVQVYAGHLIENSAYQPDIDWSGGRHPEYMRLVGSAVTTAERCVGCGDMSRFGLAWKPNLAKGKVVLRIFLVNGDSQIIAEHPHSPMIINIDSRFSGNATLDRLNYDYPANDFCDRDFRMRGNAKDAQNPGTKLNITIIDEYRGKVLAEGETDNSGSFNIPFTVNSSAGDEAQVVVPRAYIYMGGELVALQTNLEKNVGGWPTLVNMAMNVLANCTWRCVPADEICYNGIDEDCNGADACPADTLGDGCVNIADFVVVGINFGKTGGSVDFNESTDINKDSLINIFDLVVVGRDFGKGTCG